MYYVIENEYVGPNQDQHIDGDRCEIRPAPARGNMQPYPIIVEGWCGTTNDWSTRAHGAYNTSDDARAKVAALGYLREDEYEGYDINENGEMFTFPVFRYGQYAPMGAEGSEEWAYDGVIEAVRDGMAWDEIESLLIWEAHADGVEPDMRAVRYLYDEIAEGREE